MTALLERTAGLSGTFVVGEKVDVAEKLAAAEVAAVRVQHLDELGAGFVQAFVEETWTGGI